tara:strand:+ start:1754 stop:2473 length:720 start_codon:yes stop_codon:yes gene_type:complete
MKKITLITAFITVLSTAFAAHAEFSGNVSLTTDYRFRGISQGDRSPAIQGGFDVAHESGLYIGAWASNVTFSGAAIEMDYYAGFGGSINDVSYDIGAIWYNYPEDDAEPDLDYFELYGSLSIKGVTLGLAYSPDYFAETGDFIYVYGDYGFALAENLSLDLHFGWNLFNSDEEFAAFIGPEAGTDAGKNYIDYSVGFSTNAAGLDWGLSLVGTNLSKAECFDGTKLCDETLVLSVSKSL